jgi:hypothetical protein
MTAEIPLDDQPLRCASNPGYALYISHLKIIIFIYRERELKIAAVSNRSVDNETDVQPQRFARIGQIAHFLERIFGIPDYFIRFMRSF